MDDEALAEAFAEMNGEGRRAAAEEITRGWNPEALYFDGLDGAIIGTANQGPGPKLVVYDADRIVQTLKLQGIDGGETPEEAEEAAMDWFSFNTEGAYVGPYTPLIFRPLEDPDGED